MTLRNEAAFDVVDRPECHPESICHLLRNEEASDIRDHSLVFGRFAGASDAMRRVYELLERVGPTGVPVLLVGESGTGKELAARTLHALSPRREGPFIAVNAGALPSNMVESEMFGHERGSFTGAVQRHAGYFERARGGTLFLDEIAEMPVELQVKLLRVLESDTLQRVGGETDVPFDVRIVAATNASPEAAIEDGRLRKDLYFRLGVFRVDLPPLRERGSDVELLARHFLGSLNASAGTRKSLSDDALASVNGYRWPGNVRELRNLVHASFIVADDSVSLHGFDFGRTLAMPSHASDPAPTSSDSGPAIVVPVGTTVAEAERRLILATLASVHGDKAEAARILGLSLKTIYNRLKAFRLSSNALADQPTSVHP